MSNPRTCPACSAPIRQTATTGRTRVYCGTACRVAHHRRERQLADYPEPWQQRALAEGWKPPTDRV